LETLGLPNDLPSILLIIPNFEINTMSMIRYLLFICFFATSGFSNAQKISVSLHNELNLQTLLITPVSGRYTIITEDGNFALSPNQIIYISRVGDSVRVRDMTSNFGTWKRISIVGQTEDDVIRVNSIVPYAPARIYDDNLGFYVDFNRLMAINIVDIDKYIAGVVEAESGPSAQLEFYKAQALLARTYALGHMDRHNGEGFNLCDQVHCQVYKGKATKNKDILKATKETHGQVVVDQKNDLIVGAFHANCGGHTADAGKVWVTSQSYLVSVTDNFCKSQPSANWELRISFEDWLNYLVSKGVEVGALQPSDYVFSPKVREYFYPIAGKNIPLTEIRNYFNLRSAYFSIDIVSNMVRLRGKGYGHGVGMCQDGAMQMARRGKTYKEIIEHYFQGVSIVEYSSSNGFPDDLNIIDWQE
jgi:stage II sporulation protein D